MRVINVPVFWTILIDIAAWFVIHMGVSLAALHRPDRPFEKDGWLYKTRGWEQGGLFWQKQFAVRRWKAFLPDGGALFKKGFAKKHLQAADPAYLAAFIRESRRAEWTHWIAMPFALLFFLWNPPTVGVFMIVYALAVNLPCIVAQRFNRPRLQKWLGRLKEL